MVKTTSLHSDCGVYTQCIYFHSSVVLLFYHHAFLENEGLLLHLTSTGQNAHVSNLGGAENDGWNSQGLYWRHQKCCIFCEEEKLDYARTQSPTWHQCGCISAEPISLASGLLIFTEVADVSASYIMLFNAKGHLNYCLAFPLLFFSSPPTSSSPQFLLPPPSFPEINGC